MTKASLRWEMSWRGRNGPPRLRGAGSKFRLLCLNRKSRLWWRYPWPDIIQRVAVRHVVGCSQPRGIMWHYIHTLSSAQNSSRTKSAPTETTRRRCQSLRIKMRSHLQSTSKDLSLGLFHEFHNNKDQEAKETPGFCQFCPPLAANF